MLFGFCAVSRKGDREVEKKQTERQVRLDDVDQYSRPACSSQIGTSAHPDLGPSASSMLGVLRILENSVTSQECA